MKIIKHITYMLLFLFYLQNQAEAACTSVSTSGTPLIYNQGSLSGGSSGMISHLGLLEDRVVSLVRSYEIKFTCDIPLTTGVDLGIIATNVNGPIFFNSENLDLIVGAEPIGVNHQVSVAVNGISLVSDIIANTNGTTIVNPVSTGKNQILNGSGELFVLVTSVYTLIGGSEEMAAGDYSTQFNMSLTPNPTAPTINNTSVINANIGKECSVSHRASFTASGEINPIAYTITSVIVGTEERVTALQARGNIGFDCNTDDFSYSVSLVTLNMPNFSHAENIDGISSTTQIGVSHKVSVILKSPAGSSPDLVVQNLTTGYELVPGIIVSSVSQPSRDVNGDVDIIVISRFELENGAEEFAAGDYSTAYNITITAM